MKVEFELRYSRLHFKLYSWNLIIHPEIKFYTYGVFLHITCSQYSIHYTRLRESPSGFVECNVRPTQQQIGNITRIGTDGSMIIYSPGFYDTPPRYIAGAY